VTDYADEEIVAYHVTDPIGFGFSLIEVLRPRFEEGPPPGIRLARVLARVARGGRGCQVQQ